MNVHHLSNADNNVIHLPGFDKAHAGLSVNRPKAVGDSGDLVTTLLRQLAASDDKAALVLLRISEHEELVESFGQSCGDELQRQLGSRLVGYVRDCDVVQTLDGGKFAILLRHLDNPAHIDKACLRLLDLCSGRYDLGEVNPVVRAAIGVSMFPSDSEQVEEVQRFAHIALRRAESGERSEFYRFSQEMLQRQRRKIRIEEQLERALREDRFVLHYQPQYALNNHEMVGMEALVRMVSDSGELVQPNDFIGIAENSGFIVPLGNWVIRTACRQMADWRKADYGVQRIAVNVSPLQLVDDQLLDVISESVRDNGIDYTDLELEITESSMLKYQSEAGEVLHELRGRGVRIAVDDFGTGYSSFSTLAQLPLDVLKLDRSFMTNITSDLRARKVVSAMVVMARELDYQVIAEGVETVEQHQFLRSCGCDMAQGFGLARPLDVAGVADLLLPVNETALVS